MLSSDTMTTLSSMVVSNSASSGHHVVVDGFVIEYGGCTYASDSLPPTPSAQVPSFFVLLF